MIFEVFGCTLFFCFGVVRVVVVGGRNGELAGDGDESVSGGEGEGVDLGELGLGCGDVGRVVGLGFSGGFGHGGGGCWLCR